MTEADFYKLKEMLIEYCGKTYKQTRWISKDLKLYVVADGLDYYRHYTANSEGLGSQNYSIHYKANPAGYPFYSFNDLLKALSENPVELPFKFRIHISQFKNPKDYENLQIKD